MTQKEITKGAITGFVMNAIINGIINWFQVRNLDEVLVTDNLISSEEHTLFSGAVPLAVSLAQPLNDKSDDDVQQFQFSLGAGF